MQIKIFRNMDALCSGIYRKIKHISEWENFSFEVDWKGGSLKH